MSPGIRAINLERNPFTEEDSPPRGRILRGYSNDSPSITLPRTLIRGRMWWVFAFGLAFLVFPGLGEGDFNRIVMLPFVFIGLAVVGFGLFFALCRQVLVDQGNQLMVQIEMFGRLVHFAPVLKREIEQLEIRELPSGYLGLRLKAGANREFWIGSCLSREELEWLERTIEDWIRY